MTKNNKELARKIIEQHGKMTHSDKKVWGTELPILGMGLGGTGKTKAEAIDEMVDQLAGELDSGALTLSDTWAKDNLS